MSGIIDFRTELEDENGNPITDANPLPVSPFNSEDTPLEVKSNALSWLLTRILTVLSAPMGYDKSLQRQRVTGIIESGTVTTVSTVTTAANLAAIGGDQAQLLTKGANLTAWHQCVRSRIT